MVVVPDTHGLSPEELGVVHTSFIHLGDFWDSFDIPFERQVESFFAWMSLLEKTDSVCLWGNHDYHYFDLDPKYRCTGFQQENMFKIRNYLQTYQKLFRFAVEKEGVLLTHAGVTKQLWDQLQQPELSVLVEILNEAPKEVFYISKKNGGKDPYSGSLWLRPCEYEEIPFKQVVGHTFHEAPTTYGNLTVVDCKTIYSLTK